MAGLRAQGIKFVVITGARLSTLLMRLPYLPACDAFVCESGAQYMPYTVELRASSPLGPQQETHTYMIYWQRRP